MTLIVARQDGQNIAIVSDTKLTYPDHEIKQRKTDPSEGVIKTVIIGKNQCIAFAGEIDFAESALKSIGSMATDEQIIDVLKYYHILSENRTEFLYCTGNPVLIYEFKNNKFGLVPNCYLGDKNAFEIFQAYMMDKLPSKNQQEDYGKRQVDDRENTSSPVLEIKDFYLSIVPSIPSSILSKMMDLWIM
ncbi:hypothetical protein [Chitinophaga sp.]|uniref:hypothetical protein n=1 Tax=Chitinophaga sp. TaxID=1869181 RepID=UPI002F9519ED